MTVKLTDKANGIVVADAIRIERVDAAPKWELILPFDPSAQFTVVSTGTGIHGREGSAQIVEVFQSRIYYSVRQAGGSNPRVIAPCWVIWYDWATTIPAAC